MDRNNNDNTWIHSLLTDIIKLTSDKERSEILDKYRSNPKDETDSLILQDADTLSELLVRLRNSSDVLNNKLAGLSDEEIKPVVVREESK